MKNCLLLCVAVLALAVGVPASAQYMYLDSNGDGLCTTADVVGTGTTSVDVYLITNQNGDGTEVFCASNGNELIMNSYTFILRSTGGVTYGTWTSNPALAFGVNLFPGTGVAGNDRWVGRGSGSAVPAGAYRLGTQAITVSTATQLSIVASTTGSGVAITSFGSPDCAGANANNTITLGVDWSDVCGTAGPTDVKETTWGRIKALYK